MKKILYIYIILLCIGSTGCQTFLDEKPNSRVAIPQTLGDLQALLDRSENMNELSPVYGEASADDYFLAAENYARVGVTGQEAYVWEQSPYVFNNDWARSYNTANIANICLDQLVKIDRTAQNASAWDNVKGSALFYRAYAFLKLLWIHAKAYDKETAAEDLGIVPRLNADFNEKSVRVSVAESYDQIIRDLEETVGLLPQLPRHVMRPSKAAAFGLLARTYLSMREYAMALDYADRCLEMKNDLMDYNDIDPALLRPFESFNPEVIFHSSVSTFFVVNTQRNYAYVDTLLYSYYDDSDLRKELFFNPTDSYHTFRGNYMNGMFSHWMFTGITTAEMYLVRAECKARFDDLEAAMRDLNTLLEKRRMNTEPYAEPTPRNSDETLEIILKERRKELLFRGLRWIDIKRLNKEGAGIIITRFVDGKEYKLMPNDNRYALPLPIDIVDVAGIPQNPA